MKEGSDKGLEAGEGVVLRESMVEQPKAKSSTTAGQEEVETEQDLLASRERQLTRALQHALDHFSTSDGSGATLGALASLIEDERDAEAFEMARTAVLALVHRKPQAKEAASIWYVRRDGLDPDQDPVGVVELARLVARTATMYRAGEGIGLATVGAAAVDAFRDDLVSRFGDTVPPSSRLEEWFSKIGQAKRRGGLTVAGIVARIIHEGRLMGAHTGNLSKTLRRVDRILGRVASWSENSGAPFIPPLRVE